ncbi:MAG: tRNA 4-thiouridine(8) synthase ThiI [Clostridia bacterium]|nr:tRNA 4-thiouridine(8) synthase ThiI [Clostridia bacterium]
MEKVILLRYGEIYLKGKNRGYFERLLLANCKKALQNYQCEITKSFGRYYVENFDILETDEIIEKLKKVSGLHSLMVANKIPTDLNEVAKLCAEAANDEGTFRISVNRADKTIASSSPEMAAYIGGVVLEKHPKLKVDLKRPDQEINVEFRENGFSYVYFKSIPCLRGMPIGSSGKGLCLLSGGIDSPVAYFRMAKRGMHIDAVHFHSFPYTSLMAKEKVLDLAKILAEYTGQMRVYVVPFTDIQREIHEKCPAEYMITIMRRMMMRIAERLATKNGCLSLITGESLAQVASQTQESITVTNSVIERLPVFRPLIGMDKEEIIETAREIGTFETSILPYEDCCTVFLPKNPVIRPKLEDIVAAENKMDYEPLLQSALDNTEIVYIE